MLRRMPEAAGSSVIGFDLDFYADGLLAIHGKVELLKNIVRSLPPAGEYEENISATLKEHCTTESNHTTTWLMAENAGTISTVLHVDPASALLCWEEIYYDLFDQKMGYVRIYFNPAVMDLSLLLKF
jgi:hypothetical protein